MSVFSSFCNNLGSFIESNVFRKIIVSVSACIILNKCYRIIYHAPKFSENRAIDIIRESKSSGNENYAIDRIGKLEIKGNANISIEKKNDRWFIISDVPVKITKLNEDHAVLETENSVRIDGFFSGFTFGSSFCSISQNSVSYVNGIKIETRGDDVYIDDVKQDSTKKSKKESPGYSKEWIVENLNLYYVDLSGANNVTFGLGSLSSDDIDFVISGSGNINTGSIISKNVNASVSGSGEINFSGAKFQQLIATISGSGNICEFNADKCICTIYGSGSITGRSPDVKKYKSGSGSINVY